MPKMIFIEPKSNNFHIFSKFQLPRLGSFILGTMMKNRGWNVEVMIEESREIDFEKIAKADLVGISTITPTAQDAYSLADSVRKMGIPVIMGGPHVSYLPEEALRHADFVIRGEGERPLMQFIDAWESDKDFSAVPNLSYFMNDTLINNPMLPFQTELDDLPYPDFSLSMSEFKPVGGEIIIPMQTSRGCPFDCSFCSVTGMFGKKYRHRSTENIITELRKYNNPSNYIFFYDDNFTANRTLAKELLHAMIQEQFTFKWATQVRVDVVKDREMVPLMKKAGCHTIFIGLESVNPDSLKEMKKSQSVAEIEDAIKEIKKNKINIHGMFVFGFDQDNSESIEATIQFTKKVRLMSQQFLLLTPFPGSEFYKKMIYENRIIFHDWSLFDTHHAVIQPKNFTPYELQSLQLQGHQRLYSLSEIFKKLISGKILSFIIAVYARNLNIKWKKKNKSFMEMLKSIDSSPWPLISSIEKNESKLEHPVILSQVGYK